MKNTKNIVVYSNENISKYFLSPYVNFLFKKDGLVINQWLFKKTLFIKCDEKKMNNLLEKLSKGLNHQELFDLIQEIFGKESTDVFKILIKNGIIE